MITAESLTGFFCGALTVAAVSAFFNPRDTPLAREITRNEAVCQQEKRHGYMVYVVTRHGELRACLRVQEDTRDGVRPAPILIVKRPEM